MVKKKIVYKPIQLTMPNSNKISKVVKIPVGTIEDKKKKPKPILPLKGKDDVMKQRLAKLKTVGGGKVKGKGKKKKY
jgi:hypothetical protein